MTDGRPEWLSLDPDEEVRWVGQPAAVSIVPVVLVGVLFVPLLGIGLLVIAGAVLSVRNTDYVLTTRDIYVKRGVLSTNIKNVGLDRIQNTEFRQSFLGKQFDYGSIDISTAGSSGAEITFRAIENAPEVREQVTRLAREHEGPATVDTDEGEPWREQLLEELAATREALERAERALQGNGEGAPTWDEDEERGGAGASGGVSESDDVE
jgi:uncharacterized membrane protein YdbT with pleckstrin-like domain